MDKVKLPKADDDCRDLWKIVLALAKRSNALDELKVVSSETRNKLTLTESSAILELMLGATASSGTSVGPWQPYAAPYAGTGSPPANQGLKFKVRDCWVWDGFQNWFPSNLNTTFTCPAGCTDGFYGYLKADVAPSGQITALEIVVDASPPPRAPDGNATTGAPPAKAYYSLFKLTSNATAIDDFSNVFAPPEPLSLLPVQAVLTTSTRTYVGRLMRWYPYSADPLAHYP